MELTFFFVHPLPPSLALCKAVKFVSHILQTLLVCAFISMPATTKNYALTRAGIFDAELKHLVHSSAFLACKWYFVFPQSHWLVLKVFAKFNDESFDCWVHLLLEFEQNVPAEAFAKLCKLFDETTVVSCQKYKYLNGNLFRFLCKGFYLFL